jgi:hypothetical protein
MNRIQRDYEVCIYKEILWRNSEGRLLRIYRIFMDSLFLRGSL